MTEKYLKIYDCDLNWTYFEKPFVHTPPSMPHDWAAVFGWQVLAMMMVGVVFTAVRLRQEQFQREIDSLRRMAHAL